MTYESVLKGQAEMKKFFKSTFSERKIMSTKTSFKRIAAVAAVALTLGGFSAVSAHAAPNDVLTISAGTPAAARVGVASATSITITSTAASAETVTAQIVSAPATSAKAVLTFAAGSGATAVTPTPAASTVTDQTASGGVASATLTAHAVVSPSTTFTSNFKVTLKADVAGTYQVLVAAAADGSNDGYAAGDKSTLITITTAGTPVSLTVTKLAGAVVGGNTTQGAVFAASLKDANGNATVLGLNEALKVSHTSSASSLSGPSFGPGSDSSGLYLITDIATGDITTAGTDVVTVTGDGVLPSTLTSNATASVVAAAAATTVAAGKADLTDATGYSNTTPASSGVNAIYDANGSAFAITVTYNNSAGTTDVVIPVGVTGSAGQTAFATSVTIAAGKTSGAFTASVLKTLSSTYPQVVVGVGSTASVTFNYAKPAAATIAIQGSTTVLSATGGANKFVAKVADQFGNAIQYVGVSVTVSGRNTISAQSLGVTDANGLVSYTVTDIGTTGTTDSVTFYDGTHTSTAATITYGTVTVGAVSISGGSTTADAASGSTAKTAINTGDNGPEGSAVAFTATVKDANGNLLAGVPVTFSVDKGLIKKTAAVDYSVVYTGSNGKATTYAFDWIAEKQTVTATAGVKSASDYLTWAATDSTSARVLSAVVNGNVITYSVKDRFGNSVNGVTVNLTRKGSGLFGNGSSTQDVVTGTDGTVDATFTGTGSAVGTLAATYAQAYAPAGQYDFTAGDTYTAPVAGTTSGTGASLAPAGVATVAVTTSATNAATDAAQAAQDAANEATDAANAATDAANNAMDSADAAQQAAMDAGDKADAALAAVTDLATKVSEIASQISSLSAVVAKIAAAVAKISAKVKA